MRIVQIAALCMGLLLSLSSCDTNNNAAQDTASQENASWKSISPREIDVNAVAMYQDVMALSVGNKDQHNAMAIAWGGLGVLWGRPVVTVYVSTSRHTYSMMEKNEYFTVSSFPESEKSKLMYLGRYSGRDTQDKIADAGLSVEYTDLGNVRINEANLCIECKLIYKEEFIKDNIDPEVAKFYDNGTGMHNMYVGEIINVWKK